MAVVMGAARAVLVVTTVGALALAAGGCGGSSSSSSSSPVTIQAGQLNLQLPPGWKVTKGGAIQPGATGGGPGDTAANAADASGGDDTVPLAADDPQTSFFKSLGTFQSCLKGLGVKFVGVPNASNPNSPANDPGYIKNLSTCAARSNIVKALKDEQTAQDNLTPAQIQTQNQGYLKWRDCMIGKGWGIPEPKPDSKGRLFSFGTTSGPPQFTPPPGQDILTSKDVGDCAAETQQATQSGSGG